MVLHEELSPKLKAISLDMGADLRPSLVQIGTYPTQKEPPEIAGDGLGINTEQLTPLEPFMADLILSLFSVV